MLNTTKSELGKLSKHILQQTSANIRTALNAFKRIKNKNSHTFTLFGIQGFYLTTGVELLKDVGLFAPIHADINWKDIEVIFHHYVSLLDHYYFMITKDSNGDFDVTMRSYNRAEVCGLAGLLMLNELSKMFDKDSNELYRDDRLLVFKNHNGYKNGKVWKEMIDLFKQHHLNLDMKCNLKIVDYLDITFDLTAELFKPYNKTNSSPRYVNAKLNHLLSILKEIPKSVSKHIFPNSCNEHIFNAAALFYKNTLDKIVNILKNTRLRKNSTRRNIIWYNSLFMKNVETNIAKQFLHLLDKNYGRNQKYLQS